MTPQEQIDFIVGPQAPIGTSYFDQTFVAKARLHGEACPTDPPAGDDPALDGFINLNYYDLALCLYIAHRRTGDSTFLTLARKVADAWWESPHIKAGTVRTFDTFTYTPRNASLGGLILRAIDGRPELWDWISSYTRAQFDAWLKIRINNAQLHLGVRDGAFMLHYAVWLSQVLPDTFPLQAGGTATNGAQLRAQYLADVEAVAANYFGRLQYADGSWRWNDPYATGDDGSTLKGIMQPFMVGLLLSALCDAHQVVGSIAKTTIQSMILTGCRHLYSGGPHSKQLVPHFNVNLRGLHYLYHGGTELNPTKWEKGDFPFDTTVDWHVPSARQAISTILPAFGYAYKLSGDEFFKSAGDEMFDAAYNGTDGTRSLMDDTAKNFNQHARRVGSYLAWRGGSAVPLPAPQPDPVPNEPTPTPIPAEPGTPSPDGTKAVEVIDSTGGKWTIEAGSNRTLRNGANMGGGQGTIYKYVSSTVYVLGMDSNWWGWISDSWRFVGFEPGVVTEPEPQPTPTPEPTPVPQPTPSPTPVPEPTPEIVRRLVLWPKQKTAQKTTLDTQWKERYRLADPSVAGDRVWFELVPK